mmetsp:Transcript_21368/g.48113  ORF Transcript_21368/g.48113 Transcript_21368/m.48113 type:complete len:81 (-) Transcript_21368:204-446(-)
MLSPALLSALAVGVDRQLPMICANPDLYVTLPDGSRGNMPGLIAQRYEEVNRAPSCSPPAYRMVPCLPRASSLSVACRFI